MTFEKDDSQLLSTSLKRAQALIEAKRPHDALPHLAQALSIAPDNYEVFCTLAWAHIDLDENEKTLEYADQAVKANPEHEWGHRLRSIALRNLGKKEAALLAAEEAVRISPEEIYALQALAWAQVNRKKFGDAQKTIERIQKLDPDSAVPYNLLGQMAMDLGLWKEAEQYYRNSLRLDPTSYVALNNLGWTLFNLGRIKFLWLTFYRKHYLAQAIDLFQQAIRLDGSRSTAQENLRQALSMSTTQFYRLILLLVAVLINFTLIASPLKARETRPYLMVLAFLYVMLNQSLSPLFFRRLPPHLQMFMNSERPSRLFRMAVLFLSGSVVALIYLVYWLMTDGISHFQAPSHLDIMVCVLFLMTGVAGIVTVLKLRQAVAGPQSSSLEG